MEPPSHVLVNCYKPGDGIMPHEDGPEYKPVVAILSLGATAVFRFFEKKRSGNVPGSAQYAGDDASRHRIPSLSLIVPGNSLLVFRGKFYDQYLHGIDSVRAERVDSTVVNACRFSEASGIMQPARSHCDAQAVEDHEASGDQRGDENVHENAPQEDHAPPEGWQFERAGTRVSLTMRIATRKLKFVQL